METRKVKRCKTCGVLCGSSQRMDEPCFMCHNWGYDEVEYPKGSIEDEKLINILIQEVCYLIDEEFSKIKPKEQDLFGCIEMCEHLKKEYNLNDDVYELLGIINHNIIGLEHSKWIEPETDEIASRLSVQLEDGRLQDYYFAYYTAESDEKNSWFYQRSKEFIKESIREFQVNARGKIEKLIESARNLKKYTTGEIGDDFDFSLSDMKKLRTHTINLIKPIVVCEKKLLETVEKNKLYSYNEIHEILNKIFEKEVPDGISTDVIWSAVSPKLLRDDILVHKEHGYVFNTFEQKMKVQQERKDKEEKKKQEEEDIIREEILRILSDTMEEFTIRQLHKRSSKISNVKLEKILDCLNKMIEEGEVEVKVESFRDRKFTYYAIEGRNEKLKEKEEEERRIKQKKEEEERCIKREKLLKQQKASEEKYNKKLEELQRQLSEQKEIFEVNKTKIFGVGAKSKREAKRNIKYYNNQIHKLKTDYALTKDSLQAQLGK